MTKSKELCDTIALAYVTGNGHNSRQYQRLILAHWNNATLADQAIKSWDLKLETHGANRQDLIDTFARLRQGKS